MTARVLLRNTAFLADCMLFLNSGLTVINWFILYFWLASVNCLVLQSNVMQYHLLSRCNLWKWHNNAEPKPLKRTTKPIQGKTIDLLVQLNKALTNTLTNIHISSEMWNGSINSLTRFLFFHSRTNGTG